MQPMPKPDRRNAGRKVSHVESGAARQSTRLIPAANRTRPAIRMYLPPTLSARRPDHGATTIATSAWGATVRPACNALRPSADWR